MHSFVELMKAELRACQGIFLLMISRLFLIAFRYFFSETFQISVQKESQSIKKIHQNQGKIP
jgi:hypothetical protein